MKVIYQSEKVVKMWSLEEFTTTLITYITKHQFFFFSWYKIHQNNPRIKGCYYNGEESSNRQLQSIRSAEKQRAKLWLDKYKIKKC